MSEYPMERITGVIAAMITPFDSQENVDIKRTKALVDFLLERDIDGLYPVSYTHLDVYKRQLLPFTWCWFRSERLLSVRVILVGFVCSALTEITQLVFRIGLFEFDDMINNTLGCAVGCLLSGLLMSRHDRRSHV